MTAAYTLAHLADTWMLPFHPGIDDCFQCGHIIAALGAIKAFKPVQLSLILSFQHLSSDKLFFSYDRCIVSSYRRIYHSSPFYAIS